ncbi:hypothetical protein L1D19_05845 [Vibrio natriegens]|uniref:hypothetical protein n=1 Tax=Vibrio natriegens TaxID=691 RepID=UPI001EFE6356|nr:hypothetical protein [Vibrio natriegens]MCG9699654.1 hypothetical protein [Vibrio natriegens]
MLVSVMLTLDLDCADSLDRESFYEALKAKGWNKLINVDTAWGREFSFRLSRTAIQHVIRQDLKLALGSLPISYSAWYLIGRDGEQIEHVTLNNKSTPEVFSQASSKS